MPGCIYLYVPYGLIWSLWSNAKKHYCLPLLDLFNKASMCGLDGLIPDDNQRAFATHSCGPAPPCLLGRWSHACCRPPSAVSNAWLWDPKQPGHGAWAWPGGMQVRLQNESTSVCAPFQQAVPRDPGHGLPSCPHPEQRTHKPTQRALLCR